MKAIGRRYLQNIQISDSYLTGYTDNEDDVIDVLQDLDTVSGGFTKQYNKGKENDEATA